MAPFDPGPNTLLEIPQALRKYDLNGDQHLNPSEITDQLVKDVFTLNNRELQVLYHNSTLTIPIIYKKITELDVSAFPDVAKQRILKVFDEEEKASSTQRSKPIEKENLLDYAERFLDLGTLYCLSNDFCYTPSSSAITQRYHDVIDQLFQMRRSTLAERISDALGITFSEAKEALSRVGFIAADKPANDNGIISSVCSHRPDGTDILLINNEAQQRKNGNITTMLHESTHAVMRMLIGYSRNYFGRLSEGLAVFAEGSFEKVLAEYFCKNVDAEKYGYCDYVNNSFNLYEAKKCLSKNKDDPTKCLNEFNRYDTVPDYMSHVRYLLVAGQFAWLGKDIVHFIVRKLREGEAPTDVLKEAIDIRLGYKTNSYQEAIEKLEGFGLKMIVDTYTTLGF